MTPIQPANPQWSLAISAKTGEHCAAAIKRYEPGELIYAHDLASSIITNVRTRTSVQVTEETHIEDALLMYLDHSFSPTVSISFTPTHVEVHALKTIEPGEHLTFNYDTTETTMACPFTDADTGAWVCGSKLP